MILLSALSIFSLFVLALCESGEVCVYYNGVTWVRTDKNDTEWSACGRYIEDGYNGVQNGSGQLWITTKQGEDDFIAARAAGYVEGYLTIDKIDTHFNNISPSYPGPRRQANNNIQEAMDGEEEWLGEYIDFIKEQKSFIYKMAEIKSTTPFWIQTKAILEQVKGLSEGYAAATTRETPRYGENSFYVINNGGDYEDLMSIFAEEELTTEYLKKYRETHNHCTGAVIMGEKGKGGPFTAQDTWSNYNTMTRIMKSYEFNFKGVASNRVSFSSYPGTVFSLDDFYLTSNHLVVFETTVSTINSGLYEKHLRPSTVPTWIRSQVANKLAKDGRSWTFEFLKYNSGTYNNQWVIVDYNKANIDPLPKNTVVVIEMAPGTHLTYDATQDLVREGFITGINTPRTSLIFSYLGYPLVQYDEHVIGYFGYETSSRYILFQNHIHEITDTDSFYHFMRYNNYRSEAGVTYNDPGSSILSRYDVRGPDVGHSRVAFGGLDTKYVDYNMAMSNSFIVTASPHNVNDQLESEDFIANWDFSILDCENGEAGFNSPENCKHEGLEGEITYGPFLFNGIYDL